MMRENTSACAPAFGGTIADASPSSEEVVVTAPPGILSGALLREGVRVRFLDIPDVDRGISHGEALITGMESTGSQRRLRLSTRASAVTRGDAVFVIGGRGRGM